MKKTSNSNPINNYVIRPEGSLGLLALGDVGLREWRKVRNAHTKNTIDEEE
tara:strand:+ start:142937 stop:143089 length:153 start_codon:yes stop_codon:yes gene_type:complete